MRRCPDCKRLVSKRATACPYCGRRSSGAGGLTLALRIITGLIVAIVFVVVLLGHPEREEALAMALGASVCPLGLFLLTFVTRAV